MEKVKNKYKCEGGREGGRASAEGKKRKGRESMMNMPIYRYPQRISTIGSNSESCYFKSLSLDISLTSKSHDYFRKYLRYFYTLCHIHFLSSHVLSHFIFIFH
jgi:hypothetical protein